MRRAAASAGAALREAGTFTSAASGCKGGVGIDARTIKREDGVTDSHNQRPKFQNEIWLAVATPQVRRPGGPSRNDRWMGKDGKSPHNCRGSASRSGDVCECRQRRKKRAKRSGSGQNSVSDSEQRILGTVTDAPNASGVWLAEAMPQVQQGSAERAAGQIQGFAR